MLMIFVKVPYDIGSLGKNYGSGKAPDCLFEKKSNEKQVIEVKVDNSNIDLTMENISHAKGDFFIGGDHSITYGSFKGFAKEFNNPGIIVFDAHPDLEVSTSSVTHEDYLRKLIDDGILKKENVILVGIRNISKNELSFLNGMKYFTMERIFRDEENICDSVMEMALKFDGLYLSIDIDVLDPAFAPGTGYLEAGGMSVTELLYFLKRLRNLRNLKRIDLVEINPDRDVNGITVKIGRKIIEAMTG